MQENESEGEQTKGLTLVLSNSRRYQDSKEKGS